MPCEIMVDSKATTGLPPAIAPATSFDIRIVDILRCQEIGLILVGIMGITMAMIRHFLLSYFSRSHYLVDPQEKSYNDEGTTGTIRPS